jgi:hypothetical protein
LRRTARPATLYIYFNDGRYINDFVKTPQGWKVQWERIVWPGPATFGCRVDWSSDNKPGLLGTDLYFMQLPVGGPQLPTSQLSNPSLQRANGYIVTAINQVNSGDYVGPCKTITNLVNEVAHDQGLDATHQQYLTTIANRFLADDACNGLTAPDRTQSDGSWAAAAAWAAYEMSGEPGDLPVPGAVPPLSAIGGLL